MAIVLVAVSGPLRGETWKLNGGQVVLGRGFKCDIRLGDRLASRRHCLLSRDGSTVELDARDARNPVLVNGKPMRSGTVRPGDVLAIGSEQFLVARDTSIDRLCDSFQTMDITPSLGELVGVNTVPKVRKVGEGPHLSTTEQLASAFELAQKLSACRSKHIATQVFTDHLDASFTPHCVWLMRSQRSGTRKPRRLANKPGVRELKPPSLKVLKMVLAENTATCLHDKSRDETNDRYVSSLVAPLQTGNITLGLVILQRTEERTAYTQEDAEFLEILGRIATPLLYTSRVIEGLVRDNERLRSRAGESVQIVGESRVVRDLLDQIHEAAHSDLNVIIRGETGTGKDLAARQVHESSQRAEGPFVVLNCAAIPENLFESQLFGHKKGAFTGAQESFDGLFAQADGGTLFLDEIADLSLANQARILRAAELGTFRPVGATQEFESDFRIVAATNKDLVRLIERRAFREDLYHRLCGFEIQCPPLRNRVEDIPLLVESFMKEASSQYQFQFAGLDREIADDLSRRPWPGNVRELRSCVLRALANARGKPPSLEDFRSSQLSTQAPEPEELDLVAWERRHILRVLQICGGRVPEAAKILRIGRSTLYRKIAEFNIEL